MRTIGASGPLIALLNGTADFVMADLYTITLAGGATVLRYSGAMVDVTFGGHTWSRGPLFARDKITHKVGVEAATLQVTVSAGPGDTVNGVGLIPFVIGGGLDGAAFKLERAFLPDWRSAVTGTLIDFAGRVTSVKNITGSDFELTVSAWTILLNVNMPADLYQTACLNTVYDANCTLSAATYLVSGTVGGGATTSAFNTSLSQADGYFNQGRIVFTSGANNGLTRGVKTFLHASGAITLVLPLPTAPANGDAFHIYPGCDLTFATCGTKFGNSLHFRGTDLVPPVTSAM